MTLYLVSCVARKLCVEAPAKDLYTSPLFRKSRAYVERIGRPWFVLSAKYGLVPPDLAIAPYDLTLNSMRVTDRRQWARDVLTQLEPHLEGIESIAFLAGKPYREFLMPPLQRRGLTVCVPMEGLRIGERLRWLNRELRD